MDARSLLTWTELDASNIAALRERMACADAEGLPVDARSYPGYPTWPLPRQRPRRLRPAVGLDTVLARRRSATGLDSQPPTHAETARLLQYAHGVNAAHARGPTPSAGGLQSLEIYLAWFDDAWLPSGAYHYDRERHRLAQIRAGASRGTWQRLLPSLAIFEGGALLWIVVGDTLRIQRRYGERGARFLLLEAGHLMQNLCLLSTSLGLVTVPLGGSLDGEVAKELLLPTSDAVLYAGVCGR